jgi:hypothetical protein
MTGFLVALWILVSLGNLFIVAAVAKDCECERVNAQWIAARKAPPLKFERPT